MGEPLRIRDVLERLAARPAWRAPRNTKRLEVVWERMAPEGLLSHCWVSSLVNGVLTLCSDAPVWAQEVQMVAGELATRFNQELGDDLVKEIVVTVRRRRRARG